MNPVASDQLLAQLTWRYATKKFDPARKIAPETWTALEQSLVLAPSSYGLQPWRFVVVDDPAVRTRLREFSWNQSQITDASHLIVLARRSTMTPADVEAYIQRIVDVRKVAAQTLVDFKGSMLASIAAPDADLPAWAAHQVYIALGFFLSAAAVLGVDACPMEGIDPAKYDQILGLPAQGFNTVVVATAGYRAADDWLAGLPKVRFQTRDVIKHV